MGGRGRGRGAPGRTSSTFTHDQLASMGLAGPGSSADAMAPTLGPPPTFPTLKNKAPALKMDLKAEYMMLVQQEIIEAHMESAQSMVWSSAIAKSSINKCGGILDDTPWSHFPAELRPNFKRKAEAKKPSINGIKRVTKAVDIETRFKVLEQREQKGDKTTGNDEEGKEEKEELEEVPEEEELDQPDEEMDMGTDYAHDYFDNGEAFDEEDDNLDEPTY